MPVSIHPVPRPRFGTFYALQNGTALEPHLRAYLKAYSQENPGRTAYANYVRKGLNPRTAEKLWVLAQDDDAGPEDGTTLQKTWRGFLQRQGELMALQNPFGPKFVANQSDPNKSSREAVHKDYGDYVAGLIQLGQETGALVERLRATSAPITITPNSESPKTLADFTVEIGPVPKPPAASPAPSPPTADANPA